MRPLEQASPSSQASLTAPPQAACRAESRGEPQGGPSGAGRSGVRGAILPTRIRTRACGLRARARAWRRGPRGRLAMRLAMRPRPPPSYSGPTGPTFASIPLGVHLGWRALNGTLFARCQGVRPARSKGSGSLSLPDFFHCYVRIGSASAGAMCPTPPLSVVFRTPAGAPIRHAFCPLSIPSDPESVESSPM